MEKSLIKLEEYLLNLDAKDVLSWEDGKSYIDMSWIFTKPLDKKIIQKVIANIMKENNDEYEEKAIKRCNRRPEDIPGFYIIRDHGRVIFQASGADGWTKLNITRKIRDEDNANNKVNTITFNDLIKMVKEYVTGNKEVTEQEAEFLIMGIKTAFSKSFENFVDYYKYLLNEKQESQKHKCVIQPRQDTGRKHNGGNGIPAAERKNPIIDFIERDEFLKSKNPYTSVEVEEILKDGTIIPNSYTVYVYKDLLQEIEEQKGYLFICEPLNGDRRTRIMYVSEEEFEKIPVEKSEDRFGKFVKEHLDMSDEEFRKEDGTYALSHTDLESYKERIEFFMEGKKGKSLTNLKQYKKNLEGLYTKAEITLPYYTPKNKNDIATIGKDIIFSEIDRLAQNEICKSDKNEVIEW